MEHNACDQEFAVLLDEQRTAIESFGSASMCGLTGDLRLAYFSPGWRQFAQDNDGEPDISERWPLGTSVLTGISDPLRQYYAEQYRSCIQSGQVWHHDYECSTPSRYRTCHLTCYPLRAGQGLLVIHSVVDTHPHDPASHVACLASTERYLDDQGIIHQCSYCRRVRATAQPPRWDWVPAWVARSPAEASHGICPPCLDHYHPDPRIRSSQHPILEDD